jgi:hypothetical protein
MSGAVECLPFQFGDSGVFQLKHLGRGNNANYEVIVCKSNCSESKEH